MSKQHVERCFDMSNVAVRHVAVFGNMSNDSISFDMSNEQQAVVIIAHAAKVLVGFAVTHSEVLQQCLISTKTRTTANPRPHPTRSHLSPLFTFLCYCSNDNSRQTQLEFVVCIHVLTDVTSRVIKTYDVYDVYAISLIT